MRVKNSYRVTAAILLAAIGLSVLPQTAMPVLAADQDPTIQTTALRAVYDELYREEKLWAGNLKNTFSEAPELDDIYYTDFTSDTTADDDAGKEAVDPNHKKVNISQYASEHGYTYRNRDQDSGGFTYRRAYGIKGPEPFSGAKENAYKWIKKMDGGVNVRFMGGTNQTSLTSNIQEICAMALVAQTQQDNGREKKIGDDVVFDDNAWQNENGFAKLVYRFVSVIRNIVNFLRGGDSGENSNTISGTWFQNWYKAHKKYKESQAYMAYAKPLFDQSHKEGYNLQMSLLPTKWTSRTVFSSYTTTTGYTTGEVATISPGSTVNTSLSEKEYGQLRDNAVQAGRTLNASILKDYLDGKAYTLTLNQSLRKTMLASYPEAELLTLYKKGSPITQSLDSEIQKLSEYSYVGKAISYSQADLNLAARMVVHEAGSSKSSYFNRAGSVAVAQCMRNWVLHAPGNGRSKSLAKNIEVSCVRWCAPGTWNPSGPIDPVVLDLVRNVFDGVEYVNDNEYMAYWKSNGAGKLYTHCVNDSAPVSPGNGIALESYDYGFSRQTFYHDGYAKHTDAKRLGPNIAGNVSPITVSSNEDGSISNAVTSDQKTAAGESLSTGRTTNVASCTGDDDDSAELTDHGKYGLDPENFESYGFGCMTYDKFYFKDADSTDMYYDPAEQGVEGAKREPSVTSVAYVVYARDHGGTTSSDTKLTFPESAAPDLTKISVDHNGGETVSDSELDAVVLTDGSRFVKDGEKHLIRIDSNGARVSVSSLKDPRVKSVGGQYYIVDGTHDYDMNGNGRIDAGEHFDCYAIDPETKEEALARIVRKNGKPSEIAYAEYSDPRSSQMDAGSSAASTPGNNASDSVKVGPKVDEDTDPVDPALREEYDHRYVCVAPKGVQEKFMPAFENNQDCWHAEYTNETNRIRCNPDDFMASSVMEPKLGGYAGHILKDPGGSDYYYWPVTAGKGAEWYVWASYDYPEWIPEYDEDGNEAGTGHYEATVRKIKLVHKCAGGHRGYYCGGHLLIDTTGVIYHMTDAEKAAQENAGGERSYSHKMTQPEDGSTPKINPGYYPNYKNKGKTFQETVVGKIDENAVDKDGITKDAIDLFDIDNALQHQTGGISEDFNGWTPGNIESASMHLEDDWDKLYGIKVETSLGDSVPEQYTPGATVGNISGQKVNADFSKDELYDFASLKQNLMQNNGGNFRKYISDKIEVFPMKDSSGTEKQFIYEKQGSAQAWSNCTMPSNMNAEGCFIFAAAAAGSNLSGRCYLAADALAAAGSGNWTFDESHNAFSISGDPGRHSAGMKVGGSLKKLQDILDDATGGKYVATDYVHNGTFNAKCMEKIMNGSTAVIYASSAAGSSHEFRTGSAHWTYIAGWFIDSDGDPNIILLCNGTRSKYYKMRDIGRLEHVYMIDKR